VVISTALQDRAVYLADGVMNLKRVSAMRSHGKFYCEN